MGEIGETKGNRIFIQKNLVKDIQNIQYVSERCLKLDLRINNRNVTFLAIYTVIDDSIAQMKEMFYVGSTIGSNKIPTITYINGRSKRQNRKQKLEFEVIGRFGDTMVNNSEDRLINTCKYQDLKICNTFLHKNIYKT